MLLRPFFLSFFNIADYRVFINSRLFFFFILYTPDSLFISVFPECDILNRFLFVTRLEFIKTNVHFFSGAISFTRKIE